MNPGYTGHGDNDIYVTPVQVGIKGDAIEFESNSVFNLTSATFSVTASDELALNGPSGSVLGMNINGTSLVSHNGSGTLDLVGSDVTLEGSGHTQVNGSTINVVGSGDVNLVGGGGNVLTLGTASNTFSDNLNSKGIEYGADYSANFTDRSLVDKAYVDSLDAAQITGVEAGNGLIGGGTAGTVALNLGGTVSSTIVFNFTQSSHIEFKDQQAFITDSAQYARTRVPSANRMNPGYTGHGDNDIYVTPVQVGIKGDAIEFESNSVFNLTSATFSVTASDELALNGPSGSVLGMNINGTSLVSHNGSGTLDLVGSDVTLEGSGHTQVNGSTINVVGSGDVNLVGGGGNVLTLGTASNTFSDNLNSKGIEYGADYSANFTDRSLVDKAYVEARTSQPVYQSATSSVATGNTGISLTSTPNDYSRVEVYVNGQLQDLTENTTGDCYFGQAGTILSSLTSGDSLFWNSANAGFELSATDVIKVHYQA